MTDHVDPTQPDLLTLSADKILSPSQLKKNSFWGIGRCINSILLFAISYPLYLRYLGLEYYGLWVMLMAIVTCLQFSSLNLPQAAAKFISESLVRKDAPSLYQYTSTIIGAIIGMGVVIIVFTFLARASIAGLLNSPETLRPQVPYLLILAALLTFQVLAAETLGGIVSGAGRMDQVFQADILCRVLGFLLSLGLLHWHYGLLALFYGNICGYLVNVGLMLLFIRRNFGVLPLRWRYLSWQQLQRIVRFTGPLFGGSLLSGLLPPFNRLLLGAMISPAAASIYDIADKGAQVIRSTAETGIRPLIVQVSGLDTLQDDGRIRLLSLKCVRIILLWITPLFIFSYLSAGYVIPLWLKLKEASQIGVNFNILLFGYYANLIMIPIFYGFMGSGRVNICFRSQLVQCLVNVVMAVLGILLFRQIWVISLAFTAGLTVQCWGLLTIFSKDRQDFMQLIIKGMKILAIPCLFFFPLVFFQQHFYLFLSLTVVTILSYTLLIIKIKGIKGLHSI
jgi:O-antigen/teichoic acid export membrane protein